MTNVEAIYIRARFKSNPHYGTLIEHWTKLDTALGLLPDESRMVFNAIIMDMYEDAKKEAKELVKRRKEA